MLASMRDDCGGIVAPRFPTVDSIMLCTCVLFTCVLFRNSRRCGLIGEGTLHPTEKPFPNAFMPLQVDMAREQLDQVMDKIKTLQPQFVTENTPAGVRQGMKKIGEQGVAAQIVKDLYKDVENVNIQSESQATVHHQGHNMHASGDTCQVCRGHICTNRLVHM